MEEECERVEAEIAKERVHNENRMLKVSNTKMTTSLVGTFSGHLCSHEHRLSKNDLVVFLRNSFLTC